MGYDDPQALHLDSMLSGVSAGYGDPLFLGDDIAPTVKVEKDSDKYYVHTRDVWGRQTDDIRAPAGMTNELPPMTLSRDSYFLEEHALKGKVAIEDTQNADAGLDPLTDEVSRVSNTILLNRELAIVSMVTTAANYNASYTTTLSGTSQWSDYTNSNPISDVKVGRDLLVATFGRGPNTAIGGYQVMAKLEDAPDILDRMKIVGDRVSTDEVVSKMLFGYEGVTIQRAQALKLTSGYGAAETVGFVWGKDFWMGYVPPNPGRKQPAFMYEFVKPYAEAGVNGIMPTERWFDKDLRAYICRTLRKYDLKFISVDSSGKSIGGYLIKNAIA